jgi:hypothetical protein
LNHQDIPIIYSYRNILDCLVSFFQRDGTNFETFNLHDKDSIEFIKWMIELDSKMRMSGSSTLLEICYEKDIKDARRLQQQIKNFLGIKACVNPSQYEFSLIKEKTSRQENLDRYTNFWPNHLSDGAVNKYSLFLSDTHMDQINEKTLYEKWRKNRYDG